MKSISILSTLLLLSSRISAESDVDLDFQSNRNQNPVTTAMGLSDNHDNQLARGTQEDCGLTTELQLYDKQVSKKETSSFFGRSGKREVNGPIAAIFCDSGQYCPKLKLQAYSPNLPWVEGDQSVAESDNWWWKEKPLSLGMSICRTNEIVTGVRCLGQNCGSVKLRCSPLNSRLYQRDSSSRASSSWASSSNKRTRCAKGSYMVGMECKGNGCSQIRLQCAKIQYKSKRLSGSGCPRGVPDSRTCQDKTIDNGQPWSDVDGADCNDYSERNWCSKYGDKFMNIYTANQACCECGGGDSS